MSGGFASDRAATHAEQLPIPMSLRNFLTFGNRSNPFEAWPSAPRVKPIVAGKVREKGLDSFPVEVNTNPYPPTLIIAFGETGEKSLILLKEKLSQSNASEVANLRALLIKETPASFVQDSGWSIRAIELQQPASTLVLPRGITQSLRFSPIVLFQQVINYRKYQEWLQENLLDLGSNTQVFFIGSLAEPTMGLLGEALQILRNFPDSLGRANLFSRVVAFLSLQSSTSNHLPVEEIFAAYREIGRFLFAGPHQMITSYGLNRVVRSALLDAFFILEDPALLKTTSVREDCAQLLAESLFTLIHPSARTIWEYLRNDLPVSGRIQHESHQPVVHGIGVATLHIPVYPIKCYVAARLAYAAIFGEQANVAEGLTHQNMAQSEQPASTARRLLKNGSYFHPVFDWILEANSPSHFDQVPDLTPEFITVFQAQISHNLVRSLNEAPADIVHIRSSLEWLEKHLVQCEAWFKASKPANLNAPPRFAFQYVLTKWRENIQVLLAELRGWNQVLFLEENGVSTNTLVRRGSHNISNWRNNFESNATAVAKDIPSLLRSYQQNAENILKVGFNDRICRSVVSDATGDLKELEAYYVDTVRPELSRFTRGASTSFTRVRDRLEWWIRLAPESTPQLYLVCWPSQAEITPEPSSQYCFKSGQIQEFADAVFNLAFSQTTTLEADLTRNWFHQRIKLFIDFLRRASEAFLSYDHNLANLVNGAASRRSYLVSHNPAITRDFVSHVFSDTPRFEINELDDGDPTRLTAISLRLNIPSSALMAFQDMKRKYVERSPENVHLYIQEQMASLYEKRIWKLERARVLLSPDFVSLLTDPELVTLFCQALFTGVICPVYDENSHRQLWKVSALESFAELELAPVSDDGLLRAFRRFVLELPNEPDLNQSPQRNFYPTRRGQYLSALTRQVKASAVHPESHAIREGFKEELARWKIRGEQDSLAQSFSIVLQCELDEPVWKNW